MTLLQALILGALEGLTEFLPVSSTAHLVLAEKALGIVATPTVTTFTIAVQVGAILAVLTRYWKLLTTNPAVLKRLAIAFVPTAIIGALFYKLIVDVFLTTPLVSIIALGVGGVALILFERRHSERPEATERLEAISYWSAFWIGVWQALAVIPGVSRAGATIVGGLTLGLKRRTIVEFSFLLALPTLIGATALDLLQNVDVLTDDALPTILLGIIVAFIVARLTISTFLRYIQRRNFIPFGVYRIILAVVSALFLL